MIKDGKPYTTENGYIDSKLFCEIPKKEQSIVLKWIQENIISRKTPLYGHTSYGMKHYLDHDTGVYLTNNQFKDAMLISGYRPINPNELNWEYCISKKSPIFAERKLSQKQNLFGVEREEIEWRARGLKKVLKNGIIFRIIGNCVKNFGFQKKQINIGMMYQKRLINLQKSIRKMILL